MLKFHFDTIRKYPVFSAYMGFVKGVVLTILVYEFLLR